MLAAARRPGPCSRALIPCVVFDVRLSAAEVSVAVPRFGIARAHPSLIALAWRAGEAMTVFEVGAGARDLPDVVTLGGMTFVRAPAEAIPWAGVEGGASSPAATCRFAVVNPVLEGPRGLEALGAMVGHHLANARASLPWWARWLARCRVHVTTADVTRDEASYDAIAASSDTGELILDGVRWHRASPHDFRVPARWHERGLLIALLAGAAYLVGHPHAQPQREWLAAWLANAPQLAVSVAIMALQGAHAVWWHARQQRRRAPQRARLASGGPRA